MPTRRIFLSATHLDLKSYRALASASMRRRGYLTEEDPVFHLTHEEIATKLEARISACDAVVCLIGHVYGGEPADRPPDAPRLSHTQWEFHTARRLDKPVFLLLAADGAPFDPHDPEPEELRQLQRAHRADAIRDRDWRPFANVDQLRAELAELRFPWEGPPPDHKLNNLPFASLKELFKGRAAFLTALWDRLSASDADPTIVARQVIHGLGGVGKSRASIEYAWLHADDYTSLLFVSGPTPTALRSNLADLTGLLAIEPAPAAVEERLAEVFRWLDDHPGWLLILDNVDTEPSATEAERLLSRLRAGHVLITSRLTNWSAGVEPLELDVLAEADAVSYLHARARQRRRADDDPTASVSIARELGGLALALEQAGAYLDKLRLSFAEYLAKLQEKQADVLAWHDSRLIQYPASVAATWLTTFDELTEPERLLLAVLSQLAPEPIPLGLLDTPTITSAIHEPRERLAALAGYSLVGFEESGDSVRLHRLVQQIGRRRIVGPGSGSALRIALEAVNNLVPRDPHDVRTWPIWTPLAPHAAAVASRSDEDGITDPTARLMNELGLYLMVRGEHGEAERLYRRALAIGERSYGPDHPLVAIRLNNLAELFRATNRLVEAEPLFRRALAISERSYGPDHRNVAIGLSNLALLLQATNRLGEAEPLFRRALAIGERSYGPDPPDVAIGLNNLADLFRATNRLVEAEPLFRRALAIGERSYGPDHPVVAIGLNNLALLLQATNRLGEAESLFRRSLAISERSYGPDHPDVAIRLSNLAALLQDTNRLVEAEPLIRRALAIDERSYGPDHPLVAIRLNNLAALLQATNRLVEAEPLFRRALAIGERSFGPDHPGVANRLNNLARLFQDTNRLSESEPMSRRAVDILRQFRDSTGHEHPRWQLVLGNYQGILKALGLSGEEIARRTHEVS